MSTSIVDAAELRDHVREMYREVAREPGGDFHFETGRALAERLGYPADWLDAVPADALASFAGVGHMLDLAQIAPGELGRSTSARAPAPTRSSPPSSPAPTAR